MASAFEFRGGDLTAGLKGAVASVRGRRRRDAYVVAQVALSLVLLVAAGLLVRALQHAQHIAPGYEADHRLSARIYISEPEYNAGTARAFFGRVLETVRAMPGVRAAALSYSVPMGFPNNGGGCAAASRHGAPQRLTGGNDVSRGYFETLGIPLAAGRDFEDADRGRVPQLLIVNQTLAARLWPGENAVGKRLWTGCDPERAREAAVIGVARDSKYMALDEPAGGYVYSLHSPAPEELMGFMALTLHTAGDPAAFGGPLRTALRRIDPGLRIYEMRTLEEYAALSLWKVRWQAALIGGFGALALVLAAIGMYGVVAYAVAQRTREIGIRMAIGAQKRDVLWMVLARGLRLTAAGIAIGLALSAASTRLLRAFLYGVSPWDGVAFGGAALLWLAIAAAASFVPARRAAQVDPAVALRWE
jgi:putative ABC transport system permease protein